MDYRNYLEGVSFRWFQPQRRPWPFYRPRYQAPLRYWDSDLASSLVRRADLALEILNTRLPAGGWRARARLGALCEIPRMSTFAIAAMINTAVARMAPDRAFVNVGVWHGFTLLAGMIGNPDKRCVGVDNFSEFGGPREAFRQRFEAHRSERHSFHDQSYEDYFATVHREPIGVYIYDGEHSYDHQLRGLKAAEPWFAPGCLILVDDTNLPAPRDATLDFVRQSPHRYEVLLDRRTAGNLHPTLWNGVMVLQRCP